MSTVMTTIKNGIIKAPENEHLVHEKGLGWHMFECMQKNKNKIAQICAESGIKDTFGDVLQRAILTALELKRRGITSSDVISTCTLNHFNSCVPVIASIFLNCKTASFHPEISPTDIAQLIQEVKPKIIFIDRNSKQVISNAQKILVNFNLTVVSFTLSKKFEWFGNFIKASEKKEEEEFRPTIVENLRETILIFFSSGSTGISKGICLHHYGLMKNYAAKEEEHLMIKNNSVLYFTTNSWISSFQILYASIQMGFSRLFMKNYDPKAVLDVVDVHKPKLLYCTLNELITILDDKHIPESKIDSLKFIFLGGQKVNSYLLSSIRKMLPNTLIFNSFGQTEVCGPAFALDFTSPESFKIIYKKIDSCGTAMQGFSYKVVDLETGKLCGPNEKGELYIKNDFLMNGFYNRDASNEFDENGSFKTGDVFYYDEDLYFYMVDRVKEMIKYKSWHVESAKLEAALCSHPDVLNAIVIGLPHPSDGNHPSGIVKLRKGASVTPEELKIFADNQLDEKEKLRGGVHFIEQFPVTTTGKINKRLLKEMCEKCEI